MSRVHRTVELPFGTYTVAAEVPADPRFRDAVLVGVWRAAQKHAPRPEATGSPVGPGEVPVLDAACTQLLEYARGERTAFDLPSAPVGTPFQQRVWAALQQIPYGAVTTYGGIARELGVPRAAQAVGRAVGSNPLSLVVPCHRVVSSTGGMTGYAGGIDVKERLLALEASTGSVSSHH
jgi:methylated-DNA-[protein]-cysteine S-methyltransferase